ncbi:MAG TPA: Fic family protein [Gammaproteobacteria bacterium]|nr:Fic family protein [Gammaproteobacteria bacterium]
MFELIYEPIIHYNRLMTTWNWQYPDWPNFRYDLSDLFEALLSISEKMGFLNGNLVHLAEHLRTDAIINLMVEEAVNTSEIEGEHISRMDIRSSIKNSLGLYPKNHPVRDRRAHGIAELMLDVRDTFNQPLTEEKLFDWHLMLMAHVPRPDLRVGHWRMSEEPMQIVSGHQGRWIVHYEAPPASRVPDEMKKFITWFNATAPNQPRAIQFPPVRAAIAHLYFESIHPFDDGNGRIGRALAEKTLSQGFGYPVMLSLSQTIEAKKKDYYAALKAGSGTLEITEWIRYFIKVVSGSQELVEKQIHFILKKAAFFDQFEEVLNERQLKVIKRMMRSGIKPFEGGINARKYMAITKTSKATATRDLQQLFSMHILKQLGSGRSVRYELNL